MIELSVVVPVYNVEKYVQKCIESLMIQDLKSIEFIIVDDGSKDNSISIIESMISDDSRFKIIHKPNGGLMSAWKAGVKVATGEYIGFVDSDDWVDANMYSTMLQAIKEEKADVVSSGFICESWDRADVIKRDKRFVFENDEIRNKFLEEYCTGYFKHNKYNPTIIRCDKVYRKEILLKNMDYFSDKVSLAEDFNTNIAIWADAKKIVLLENFCPYHYRYNPSSIVHSYNPKAFDNIKTLSAAIERICKEKNMNSLYPDSFIGNMLFEEVIKECTLDNFSEEDKKRLRLALDDVNADHYLKQYLKVRNKSTIRIYSILAEKRAFGLIRLLTNLYNKMK